MFMKYFILSIILVLTFSCKKKKDPIKTPIMQSCSPLPALEGIWNSDSLRQVQIKNHIVIQDSTIAFNTPTYYLMLKFYCYQNIPIIYGDYSGVSEIDNHKYQIFGNKIYIGDDIDTTQMTKLYINSLVGNHLILWSYLGENVIGADTIKAYQYQSMRKK